MQVAGCGSDVIVLFLYIQLPSIISEYAFLNPDYYFYVFVKYSVVLSNVYSYLVFQICICDLCLLS